MRIIKPCTYTVLGLALASVTQMTMAQDAHHSMLMSAQHESHSSHDSSHQEIQTAIESSQIEHTAEHAEHAEHANASSIASRAASAQHPVDHKREHGGQIYQATEIDSRWLNNADGRGSLKTEIESRIGTDENKLFIKLHADKAESQDADYAAQVMYSRMISDFWDAQIGARYRVDEHQVTDKEQLDATVGLHGLAPYFFETDAYLYLGAEKQVSFSLETERDLLLTQKLILKPYLNLDVVLSDDSAYAQKTGLSAVWLGLETRYEINKKLMPFIDVAYSYEKGNQHTAWQAETGSEKHWWYGAGLRLKF